ncbi:MAG: ABC transporter ATP-binding protein [Deltaproteobacteria bacterium]|nr:ABC transporter ATP-binding protein [Deltaproteobacteria bacterium]
MSADGTQAEATVRAVRLSKWYGPVVGVHGLTLELGPGAHGLLGPNGSGKTTFLRMCAGQLQPSLGEIKVCGGAPFANPDILRRIGLCPEVDAMYDELTGLELVTFMAELAGFSRKDARDKAAAELDLFGLKDAMERRVGGYSRGMRQRAKLAQAVIHDPDVLILDEPLTGTDPVSRALILDIVRKKAKAGACVLFSTHVLHEVEALTESILLIARGQLVAEGTATEIRDVLSEHPHHVRVETDRPRDLARALVEVEGIHALRFLGDSVVEVETHMPDAVYTRVPELALSLGVKVRSLTSPDASLEALFHYLVERGTRATGTGSGLDASSSGAPYRPIDDAPPPRRGSSKTKSPTTAPKGANS